MGRAPCCEKMGLKKGPWTPEEDQILINYVHLHGHSNWRALPKQAGLLRCGKSCRLRWTNYLRPDIKRGNFTKEEEDTIINLHHMLGNRWSAIAARLPGRTDNEIKNVWHTHLKKRLHNHNDIDIIPTTSTANKRQKSLRSPQFTNQEQTKNPGNPQDPESDGPGYRPLSPCSDVSTVTTSENNGGNTASAQRDACGPDNGFSEIIDETFLSEVLYADNSGAGVAGQCDGVGLVEAMVQFSSASYPLAVAGLETVNGSNTCDDLDFWLNLFTPAAGDLLELPEF